MPQHTIVLIILDPKMVPLIRFAEIRVHSWVVSIRMAIFYIVLGYAWGQP